MLLATHGGNLEHFQHFYQENEQLYTHTTVLFQLIRNFSGNSSFIPIHLHLLLRGNHYQHS